jgi:hypothetical protein
MELRVLGMTRLGAQRMPRRMQRMQRRHPRQLHLAGPPLDLNDLDEDRGTDQNEIELADTGHSEIPKEGLVGGK